jgi:xanthine/uracil permease
VDRRRTALVLLLLFIVCLGVATVLSGSRPGLQQGIAPTVAAVVGYLFAFVAAVLLIVPAAEDHGGTRTLGVVILGALVVLVLVDLFVAHGPDIGAGFVQLIGEVVILVAAVRLARVAAARRAR